MKDFDFDELDRAVSSVLTKKPSDDAAKPAVTVAEPSVPVQAPQSDEPGDSAVTDATDDTSSAPVLPPITEPEQSVIDEPPVSLEPEQSTTPESTVDAALTPEDLPAVPTLDAFHEESHETTDESLDQSSPVVEEPAKQPVTTTPEQENTLMEAPEAELVKVDTIPHKRGRFMDVVPPAGHTDMTPRPMPTRSGVALAPSADFKVEEEAPISDGATETVTSPDMPNMVDEEVEPSPTDASISDSPDDQPADGDVMTEEAEPSLAEHGLETPEQPSDATMSEATPEPSETTEPTVPTSHQTPFIPDVPVEKRPLNADASTPASDTLSAPSDMPPAAMPKEFGEEIMAVEANETVGEAVPAESDSKPADAPAKTPTAATSIAPQYRAAEEKTDTQSHPVFDADTYHKPLEAGAAKHGVSKVVWFIIAGVLFLTGSVLGVLYFLYGQQ
ncbi:MAG: hypothetical protein WAU02_03270 [Candidatus Saccharimonadales bacterium]